MTVRELAGEFIRLISWFCFEHEWTRWELVTAAGAVLLLSLILRLLRKETLARTRGDELPERSPIIGLRLAAHKRSRREIRGLEKSRSASAPQRHGSEADTPLEQQLAQLTAANKRLRDEVARHRQAEVRLEQQITKLMAANARLQQQVSEQKPSENIPVQSVEQKPRKLSGPLSTEELSRLAELGRRLAPPRSS